MKRPRFKCQKYTPRRRPRGTRELATALWHCRRGANMRGRRRLPAVHRRASARRRRFPCGAVPNAPGGGRRARARSGKLFTNGWTSLSCVGPKRPSSPPLSRTRTLPHIMYIEAPVYCLPISSRFWRVFCRTRLPCRFGRSSLGSPSPASTAPSSPPWSKNTTTHVMSS